MDIEIVTDLLLKYMLSEQNVKHEGVFIEIGLGSLNYSFIWARKLGLRCYAVEPLPSAHLIEQALKHNVDLTESAIADVSGKISIYLGNLNGVPVSDISSLCPDWWGGGTETKTVNAISLHGFVTQKRIPSISCLKIDTEGSELAVISGLRFFKEHQLPKLIVFEYGGGGNRTNQTGGWQPKFFDKTIECLRMLKTLGYTYAVVIEQAADVVKVHELAEFDELDNLFPSEAVVGNIMCTRGIYALADIRRHVSAIRGRVWVAVIAVHCLRFFGIGRHYIVRFGKGIVRRLPIKYASRQ